MGAGGYCRIDLSIVRGLAYYTGIVHEVFDAQGEMRAIAGGGRYDNLLKVLGGPEVGATGFGMGDVVLGILLEEKGKIPQDLKSGSVEYFIIEAQESLLEAKLRVAAALRAKGVSADFSYRFQAIGKQLKNANSRGAKKVVIVQAEDKVPVKDLATGTQVEKNLGDFLKET